MQGRRSGGQGARFYAALCIVSCDPEARGQRQRQRQRRQLTPFSLLTVLEPITTVGAEVGH